MAGIAREWIADLRLGRRGWTVLALALFAALARVALPYLLLPLIVSRADAALVGRIELADLDLSLLRGGVTLHEVAVHLDERPAPGSGAPGTAPPPPAPFFAAKRLWTQISWLALLRRTLRIEDFELDDFTLRLDRTDRGLALPTLAAAAADSAAAPSPEATPAAQGGGWALAADRLALRGGRILFTDHTLGEEPQHFDLAVEDLSAEKLALVLGGGGAEPGRVQLSARIGDGEIGVDARLRSGPAGPAVTSNVTLVHLPLAGVRAYASKLGWSDLQARLDAQLLHRFESGGAHELSGTVSLSDVAIHVPGLTQPALAWRSLAIELERIDLAARHAVVSKVRLEGGRAALDLASGGAPVPLLQPPPRTTPEARPSAAQAPPEPAAAAPPQPWTWRVGELQLAQTTLELLGADRPLELDLEATLRDASAAAGSRWPLSLELRAGQGKARLAGALAVTPLAFDGTLEIADLALPPLLARIAAPGVQLLQRGIARGKLAIALTPRRGGAGDAPPTDLRVSGTLGLADLALGDAATQRDFGVQWKDFELGIHELALPGLLGAAAPSEPGRERHLTLDRLHWIAPAFQLTRTAQGFVLPALNRSGDARPGAAAAAPPPAPAPTSPAPAAAGPAAAPAAGPGLDLEIAQLQIDAAQARLVDRTAQPLVRVALDRLDLTARGAHWPGPRVENLVIDARGLGGATLGARGSLGPARSQLRIQLAQLPLAQFTPYAAPFGYSIAGGSLALDTEARLQRDQYDAPTKLVVSALELGGARGESLFQQSFGIPLSVALGLLKDLSGNIALSVPVSGDPSGTRLDVKTLVAQALRRALVGALSAPLKLLGAVTGADGKVQSLAPEPIVFAPGAAQLGPESARRLQELARLLAASPGLSLTLSGHIAETDLRLLRERALLAQLQAGSGLRGLAELGTRRTVRRYLEAELAGTPPEPLAPQPAAWLEQHLTDQALDPTPLAELARARAEAVRTALLGQSGIAPERLAIVAADSPAPAPQPGVSVTLGGPPAR